MKRLIYILSLICLFTQVAYSQLSKVNEAAKLANDLKYDEAKIAIDLAILDAAMDSSDQAYYIRGFIYKKLYKEREMDNAQSAYRNEACTSLKRSLDINSSGEYSSDCKQMIKYLINTMYNDAVKALNKQNFSDAFHN